MKFEPFIKSVRTRADELRPVLDAFVSSQETNAAIVADGWTESMACFGMRLHCKTWDIDRAIGCIESEISDLAGLDLEAVSPALKTDIEIPKSALHVWPTLPGAGVSPVLYGILVGIPFQSIRSSRHSSNFHLAFVRAFNAFGIHAFSSDWQSFDEVIISGTDDAVSAVRQKIGKARLTGYGHRVSFAVIADHVNDEQLFGLATDIALWNQNGCFSIRAVFVDDPMVFTRRLAQALDAVSTQLGLEPHHPIELAARRNAAKFDADIVETTMGWIEHRDMWNGDGGNHQVIICPLNRFETGVGVERQHLQGALVVENGSQKFTSSAKMIGVTRIETCPGQMHAPPIDWPHDGQPNVQSWLRPRSE